MIFDAQTDDRGIFERIYDVCVVGSGPAGLSLARRLAAQGRDVALMEGGALEITADSQELYEGEILGFDYWPLDVTRLRYFGGSSNHWGGRCRPLEPHDFEARSYHPLSGWPMRYDELAPYEAEADAILDLPPKEALPDMPMPGGAADFRRIRFRLSPPTRLNAKYRGEIAASNRIRLALRANLVDLRLNEAGTAVTEALFRSYDPEDNGFTVRAKAFCLCLGGLENPRALLNANRQMPMGIGNQHDLVGRFFCEHPTYHLGRVLFEGDVLETTGYAPTPDFMARAGILNFDLLMETKGLDFMTEAQRSLACSTDFTMRLAEKVLGRPFNCDHGGLVNYFQHRNDEDFRTGLLGVILEQALNPESRVLLTGETDRFGLRRLALDWQLSELDYHTMRVGVTRLGEHFAAQGLGRVQVAEWLLEDEPTPPVLGTPRNEVAPHHHMCTTRMSDDPKQGVVDRNCKVHGIANLYMGGSSSFATVGHANPTYTIVQMALRLGDHLAERAAQGLPAANTVSATETATSDANVQN